MALKDAALKEGAWRLDPAAYPAQHALEPRYGDMDANAHLNNVALARLFEETRVRTLSRLRTGVTGGDPSSMMIVHLAIDYLAEGRYPEVVTAGLAVTAIGRSSFRLGLGLFQCGAPIAIADCAMVNMADGRPAPVDEALRAKLEGLRHG